MDKELSPNDQIFTIAESMQTERETQKRIGRHREIRKKTEGLGEEANSYVAKLPDVPEEAIPAVDGIINEALVKSDFQMSMEERQN